MRHPDADVVGEPLLQDLEQLVDPPGDGVVDLVLLVGVAEFLHKDSLYIQKFKQMLNATLPLS